MVVDSLARWVEDEYRSKREEKVDTSGWPRHYLRVRAVLSVVDLIKHHGSRYSGRLVRYILCVQQPHYGRVQCCASVDGAGLRNHPTRDVVLVFPVPPVPHMSRSYLEWVHVHLAAFPTAATHGHQCSMSHCYLAVKHYGSSQPSSAMQDIPQQQNGSDCGVFALQYCEALARDGKLDFNQADMPDMRMRIAVDIVQLRVDSMASDALR